MDYSCGTTDFVLRRYQSAVISNPIFPEYGIDNYACTWFATAFNSNLLIIVKFRIVRMDSVVGTLLIGEGSDSENRTTVIAEIKGLTTPSPIETGANAIWATYASLIQSRGFEMEFWAAGRQGTFHLFTFSRMFPLYYFVVPWEKIIFQKFS